MRSKNAATALRSDGFCRISTSRAAGSTFAQLRFSAAQPGLPKYWYKESTTERNSPKPSKSRTNSWSVLAGCGRFCSVFRQTALACQQTRPMVFLVLYSIPPISGLQRPSPPRVLVLPFGINITTNVRQNWTKPNSNKFYLWAIDGL